MIEIPVELGPRSYPIAIGHGLAAALPDLLGRLRGRRFVVVSNARIWSLHASRVEKPLKQAASRLDRVLIPEGEKYKTRDTLALVHDAFLERALHVHHVVRDADGVGGTARVVRVLDRAAALLVARRVRIVEGPEPHRDAEDVVALAREQTRRHRRIDAAAHRHDHALLLHRKSSLTHGAARLP